MYGTDLISVLALAYATNQSANASTTFKSSSVEFDGYYDPDAADSINIYFTINADIQNKITTTEYYNDPETNVQKITNPPVFFTGTNPQTEIKGSKPIFKANTQYSLKADPTKESEMEIVGNIKKIVIDGNSTKKSYKTRTGYYNKIGAHTTFTTEIVTDAQGFDDFKKCIFECYDIKYSSVGKIKEMFFRQKNV